MRVIVTLALTLVLCLGLTTCQPRKQQQSQARRYRLKGEIVSVDRQARQAVIDHDEIPGYMSAMTMSYATRDRQALEKLAPGDQIQAALVVEEQRSWLENVVIVKKGGASQSRRSSEFRLPEPGVAVPNFVLVNQDGKRIHLREYQGKAVLLTFIYTRCPLPDYCPLMTSNFVEINDDLRKSKNLYQKTRLLSISIDPEYDTPHVLRTYGSPFTGEHDARTFSHWQFASASPEELKEISRFFGLQYWEEEGQIVHSMSTALISPQGKLYRWYPGNKWKPVEVVNDLVKLLQTCGLPSTERITFVSAAL